VTPEEQAALRREVAQDAYVSLLHVGLLMERGTERWQKLENIAKLAIDAANVFVETINDRER
jgi:hypothetical protein